MGFRFRRSVRLLPGVRLNISKSGVSASLGGRGAMINLSRKGARGTIGLPGTGLSYSDQIVSTRQARREEPVEGGGEVVPVDDAAPAPRTFGMGLLGRLGKMLTGR